MASAAGTIRPNYWFFLFLTNIDAYIIGENKETNKLKQWGNSDCLIIRLSYFIFFNLEASKNNEDPSFKISPNSLPSNINYYS